MNYILFDDETRQSLLPFTFTRPVCEIRIGILTIREKWEWYLKQTLSFFTEKYLSEKFPLKIEENNVLEEGAKVECSILNGTDGYIYIGKKAEVMEGSLIRGSFALCEGAQVRMGAKVYGPTTIGPHCRIGGEVTRSVLFGYSNKA